MEGHITDAHGQPLPNVPVSYTGKVSGTTTTDGGGRFQIVGLMGEVEIAPAWDGWTFTPTSTTVTGQSESVDFSRVTGSDPLFIPVSAELVRLYDPNPKGEPAVTWELRSMLTTEVLTDTSDTPRPIRKQHVRKAPRVSVEFIDTHGSWISLHLGSGYAPDDPTLLEYESLDVEVYLTSERGWVLTGTMTVEPTKRIVPEAYNHPR